MLNRFLLVAATLLAAPSFAAANSPLLTKSQDAGYTMPQYHQSFSCNIFTDRVEIARSFGSTGIASHETRAITLTGDVAQLIKNAAAEPLESEGTLCDAPGTMIVAYSTNVDEPALMLYGHSTCSQDGTRKGEASTVLLNIANGLCGEM